MRWENRIVKKIDLLDSRSPRGSMHYFDVGRRHVKPPFGTWTYSHYGVRVSSLPESGRHEICFIVLVLDKYLAGVMPPTIE